MKKSNLIFQCLMLFFTSFVFGQGCSDAGFCTISSFKPNSNDSIISYKNQLKTGAFYGSADNSIDVFGSYFEYNRQVNPKLGVDLRLTTLGQNGNGISVFGLSDIFIATNYRVMEKLKFTLGTKIPLSNSGRTSNNLPLPMDYQSSLGTLDVLFGIGYEINNVQIAAAIQQPLLQNNNAFLSNNYPLNSDLNLFQSTNSFKRNGDLLVRVSYPISIHQKFKLTPSILPIYHLGNDTYKDELDFEKEIIGSKGLTLNGTMFLDYEINKRNVLQFNLGIPFVVREKRPDGLTRSFIANFEYRIKF